MVKTGLMLFGIAFLNCIGLLCSIPHLKTLYEQPPTWFISWLLCTCLVSVIGAFVGFIGSSLK